MGTKLKPGKFDCYDKAEQDEPMFVLLARDPLAPVLVRIWATLREQLHGDAEKIAEGRQCADDMDTWRESEDRFKALCPECWATPSNPTKGCATCETPADEHPRVL